MALDSHTDRFGSHDPQTFAAANRLAIAFGCAGEIGKAIALLDQILDRITSSFGDEHPMRMEALNTLGEILFEQRHLEQASLIRREVLAYWIRHAGASDPSSLAAQGDMAAVLFELGQDAEASSLEDEAFASARANLGRTHPVTSVLAWNRALRHERNGDPDAARRIVANDLVWLLAEVPSSLEDDQRTIQTMLAERWNWDAAGTC